jgi:hypothetical protein
VAAPNAPRAIPGATWRPNDPALGAAPADGDFARLLEAASSPAAHRMRVPPEIEGWGPTRPGRRVPYGPPGMVRDLATTAARGGHEAASGPRPGAGAVSEGSHGGPPDLVGALSRLSAGVRRWSERPPRERLVLIFIALVALWMLLGVIDAAARSLADDPGLLIVLGVVAFFVLRGWIGSRRRRPGDTG